MGFHDSISSGLSWYRTKRSDYVEIFHGIRGRRCSGQIDRFFFFRNFTRYPRMMNGGVADLLNGRTPQKPFPNFPDTISRTCRPTSDSMTCVCANPATTR